MVSWYGVMKELVFLKFRKQSQGAISSARYDAYTESLFRNGTLLKIEDIGSFHVKSSNFWPYFHGHPPIILKFGTLVGIV